MNLVKMFTQYSIIRKGHFLLTKGDHSELYVNKDSIWQYPEVYNEVIAKFVSLINNAPMHYQYVTGPAAAGAMFAVNIAKALNLPFVYPEKIQTPIASNGTDQILYKTEMKFRRGFDKFIRHKIGLVIEDIVTTGGSVNDTLAAIRECDSFCGKIIVLWNRTGKTFEGTPSQALIQEPVLSFSPNQCPLCKEGIPLTNPKEF